MAKCHNNIALSAESRLAFEFDIKTNPHQKNFFRITSADNYDSHDGNSTTPMLEVLTPQTKNQLYNQPKPGI